MAGLKRPRSTLPVLSALCCASLFVASCARSAAIVPIAAPTTAMTVPPSVSLEGLSLGVFLATALSVVAIPIALFGYFIKVFNVDLSLKLDEATTKALDKMVQFCYIFMFTTFVLLLSPFVFLLVLPTGVVNSIYSNMFSSPLAFVIGCVADQNPEHVLWELACQQPGPPRNEWLVNIGGYVSAPTPMVVVNNDTNLEAGSSPSSSAPAASSTASASATESKAAGGGSAAGAAGVISGSGSTDVGSSKPSSAPKAIASPAAGLSAKPSKSPQTWYAFPNPSSLGNTFPMAVVSGGITVPFYFILVALFGASISMTQKIPDFQAQLAEGSLSPPRVRKGLTIQVLQFVSAPFLAIIAYAFFGPTGQTATITVAFVAGFSSQTILTSLLAAMNGIEAKAKPEEARTKPQETASLVDTPR